MKIERVWAMPNHKTFQIPAIKKLLLEETIQGNIIDPFPYPFKQDALSFLRNLPTNFVDNLRFDPPYSQRQLIEMYHNAGLSLDRVNNGYWAKLRDEISRVTKPGGKVVSFGWNSTGIGKNRGFTMTRILLVCHGSQHNDTIVTVEIKNQSKLFEQTIL